MEDDLEDAEEAEAEVEAQQTTGIADKRHHSYALKKYGEMSTLSKEELYITLH